MLVSSTYVWACPSKCSIFGFVYSKQLIEIYSYQLPRIDKSKNGTNSLALTMTCPNISVTYQHDESPSSPFPPISRV